MRKNLTIMIGALLIIALFAACTQEPYDAHLSVNATITLDGRGYDLTAIGNTLTVNGSSGVELPVLKNDDSKTFLGWSLKSDGTASDLVILENGRYYPERNGDITLYAIWANNQVRIYYHYNIDADNDVLYSTSTVALNKYNVTITLPTISADIKNTVGLNFIGWSLNKEAGPNYFNEGAKVDRPLSDTHYYAQWAKPVTITWTDKDGNVVDKTTTLKAFGNLVLSNAIPDNSADGTYRYTGKWLDGNTVVSASTIVYSDKTYTAQYGNKVDIKFVVNGEEVSAPANYENFTYETPNSDSIENFAGWFTAEKGGEEITDTDVIPVGIGSQTLYARVGRNVTINAVGAPEGYSTGSLSIAEGVDTVRVKQYPYIGEFFVPSELYSSDTIMDESTMVIDIAGNIVNKEFDGDTLYAPWTPLNQLYGDIIYKNISNPDADKYTFYYDDFTKVDTDNVFVFNEKGQLNDPTIKQPTYYYAEDKYLAKETVTDIADSTYVIIYKNGDSRYKSGISFSGTDGSIDQTLREYFFEAASTSDDSRPFGYKATERHIEVYGGTADTIGWYVKSVRETSEAKDWFVPTAKEMKKIVPEVYVTSGVREFKYLSNFFGLSFIDNNMVNGLLLSSVTGSNDSTAEGYRIYGSGIYNAGYAWVRAGVASNVALFRMI